MERMVGNVVQSMPFFDAIGMIHGQLSLEKLSFIHLVRASQLLPLHYYSGEPDGKRAPPYSTSVMENLQEGWVLHGRVDAFLGFGAG